MYLSRFFINLLLVLSLNIFMLTQATAEAKNMTVSGWYGGAELSYMMLNKLSNKTFITNATTDSGFRFSAKGDKPSSTALDAFVGHYWSMSHRWFPGYRLQLNLSRALSPINYKGQTNTVIDGNIIGSAENFDYKLNLTRIQLVGIVDLYRFHRLSPFVGLGIGTTMVAKKSFSETASGPDLRLSDASKTNISYLAMLGLRYNFHTNWSAILTDSYRNDGKGQDVEVPPHEVRPFDKIISNTLSIGVAYQFS